MRPSLPLLLLLLIPFLPSCSGTFWQRAFTPKVLIVSYDDLGPESLVSPVLGPRGMNPQILVHGGGTRRDTTPRRLNVRQGLSMLRRNARQLPKTAANAPLRQRMNTAYNRLHHYYGVRRDAFLSVPSFGGRGSMTMTRTNMMPPMPPTLERD